MKVFVVLVSVMAVSMCAPIGETEEHGAAVDSDDIRVKRAKEVMMFGNQQNEASREKAKRDDSLNVDNQVDKEGLIVAKEPVEISTSELEQHAGDAVDIENNNDSGDDNIVEQDAEEDINESEISEEANGGSEDSSALEAYNGGTEEGTEDQVSFEDYLKELEKMQGNADMNENSDIAPYLNSLLKDSRGPYTQEQDPFYQYYNNVNYSPYRPYARYRRSQSRILNGAEFPRSRVLKRGHRTKRQAYYVPEVDSYIPYDDRYLDMPYNNYPIEEEDLAELLDLLDSRRNYEDDDVLLSPYEGYEPYDNLEDVEFEAPIYVPKRQAGLSFVPGLKRSRDFYPYFEEPNTHFAAFIPDKRTLNDYAGAYQRVMGLAAALGNPNYYPERDYYEGYRRK